jgi:hypothetical protein
MAPAASASRICGLLALVSFKNVVVPNCFFVALVMISSGFGSRPDLSAKVQGAGYGETVGKWSRHVINVSNGCLIKSRKTAITIKILSNPEELEDT